MSDNEGSERRCTRSMPLVTVVLMAIVAVVIGACGSDGSDGDSPATADDSGPGLRGLAPELRAAYKGSGQTTADSPYFDFKPKQGPPWTIAYASTYSGNTWRADVMDELKKQFEEYKALGLVDKLIITESNGDVARTSQQIRQALDKGADGIITIAPSATGINAAIDAAFRKGVPVVNFESPVTSINAINSGVNNYEAGRMQAEYVADKVGKGGRVIFLNGIPGFSASEQMKAGTMDVYAERGVKVVASADGYWTNPIAKTALLKLLSTTPGKVDFVHQQAGMGQGAIEALKQTGRGDIPVLIADDIAGAVYWQKDQKMAETGFSEFPARSDARLAWELLMRTLEGQQPKITSILRAPATFSYDDLATLLPADATTKNTDWVESLTEDYYTKTVPKFFAAPLDPKKFEVGSSDGSE
jgi:ribose transport system substrate-binding protein